MVKTKKYNILNKIIFFFIIIILIIIIYKIIYYVGTSLISYEKPIHLTNNFTNEEITIMQSCTNNTTNVNTPCYKNLHKKIVDTIKNKLNLDYLYIDHARFSNNSNGDGQSFHKDIKPNILYNGYYPKVYTIILYLDNTGIYIGNNKILVSPGDIIIFNAFNLHKSIGMNPHSSTHQRRVLQLFCCFFDENEKNIYFTKSRNCNHNSNYTINKYLNYYIDLRWLLEYMNLTKLYTNSSKCNSDIDTDFTVYINEQYYINTIDNVKYYSQI